MENTERTTSWQKIQRGVKDTERLIGQKQYNAAMVKARQTLEYMVKCLGERACIVDGDLMNMIDELYQGKWISKSTFEHYHKIRTIGNKAVHEGNDNAYDANQAYHLLSQEVYVFADSYAATRRRRSSSSGSGSGARRRRKKRGLGPEDLMKIFIPVLIVVLLLIVIRIFKPGDKDETKAPTSSSVISEQMTVAPTSPAPTEAPTTAPAPVYKSTDTLNVRKDPSTNNPRIGQIPKGSAVEYIKDYDEKWAIISYNGQEAYVAKEYLTAE